MLVCFQSTSNQFQAPMRSLCKRPTESLQYLWLFKGPSVCVCVCVSSAGVNRNSFFSSSSVFFCLQTEQQLLIWNDTHRNGSNPQPRLDTSIKIQIKPQQWRHRTFNSESDAAESQPGQRFCENCQHPNNPGLFKFSFINLESDVCDGGS